MTAWTTPRDGAGTWTHTPRPAALDWVVTLLACLIGGCLLLGLYVAARGPLCDWHQQQLRMCPGYEQAVTE